MSDTRMRLDRFLEEIYLAMRVALKPSSQEQLALTVGQFSQFLGRPARLEDLRIDKLRGFLTDFYAGGRSPVTVNDRRRMLLTLWRAAADEELLAEPRTRRVPKVKEPKHLLRAFTLQQLGNILTVCRRLEGYVGLIEAGPWWTSLVLTLFDTGARIKALRVTASADYNPAQRSLLLRAHLQKPAADQLLWVSEQTAGVLAEHYNALRPLIWPWPYCQRHLWRHFHRIVGAAGVPVSTRGMDLFQRVRRTAVSYAAQTDIRLATELAGHCREELTRKHYIDPSIAALTRRAIDCLPRPTILPAARVMVRAAGPEV